MRRNCTNPFAGRKMLKIKNGLMWPAIFCLGEKRVIGISYFKTRKKKLKMVKQHWLEMNSTFLPGYRIDFSNASEGDLITCPHCGERVDLRLFRSDTKPRLIDAKPASEETKK